MSMRRIAVSMTALVMVALSGCATYVDVKRTQKPIYQVEDEQPGVGLLNVSADDEVMARAPNDFSNMTGLVSKVAKDYFAAARPEMKFVDYTDLGFQPVWKKNHSSDKFPYTLENLAGIPAGAQTPLVTVVKVVDWRTFNETIDKKTYVTAHVALQFSTWTREGQLVKTELVDALAREGMMGVSLKSNNESPMMVHWFQKADGQDQMRFLKADREKLFWAALQQAVGLHFFPFFEHGIAERHVLIDDEPYKPGVLDAQAGRYEDALAKWTAVYEADPKAHGALYNAGLVHMMKGDDKKALECFTRAVAGEDKFLYRSMRDSVKDRLSWRKTIRASGVTAANDAL